MAEPPAATPPEASTPISANCEPPLNITRLSTQACHTSRPDAVASAPKDTPYAAVAIPTAHPERAAARSSAVLVIRPSSGAAGWLRRSAVEEPRDETLGGVNFEGPWLEDDSVDEGGVHVVVD